MGNLKSIIFKNTAEGGSIHHQENCEQIFNLVN